MNDAEIKRVGFIEEAVQRLYEDMQNYDSGKNPSKHEALNSAYYEMDLIRSHCEKLKNDEA